MPSRTITLFSPFLGLVSGSGDALLTLNDADDRFFDLGHGSDTNQSALLDGSPVTVNSISQSLGVQSIVAVVDGLSLSLNLQPVRVVIEGGLFDDSYIYFPGLPEGATIVVGVSVSLLFSNDVAIPLCLEARTLIRTPEGLRPVGTINVGDLVETVDGGPCPVRWVGRQRIDFAPHPRMRPYRPIVIRKAAFGPQRPFRDLIVSPHHAILLENHAAQLVTGQDDVLTMAKFLVNDTTIRVVDRPDVVTYCHVMFDRHQIIWANGLAVESLYLGDLLSDPNCAARRNEVFAIFPELSGVVTDIGPRARPTAKAHEAKLLAMGLG